MKRFSFLCLLAGALSLTPLLALSASGKGRNDLQGSIFLKGQSKSQYAALAALSLQDAIYRATSLVPGRVVEAALENEDGYLVYSVEVVRPNQSAVEILIDAGNGKVLVTKDARNGRDDSDEDGDERG